MISIGCRREIQLAPSPETTYQELEQQFITGNLLTAQQTAEAAYQLYASQNPIWSARFRIELARVRLYQGRSSEVVELLRQPLPPASSNEIVVRKDLLLAMAEARLSHADDARRFLDHAETLHPEGVLQAEWFGAKGSVALEQGHLSDAERLFQSSLDGIHHPDAKFLETQMWMNLGVVALQQEHYEDAVERFDHASTIAQTIGARLALEKALGNLGWTYYQIGDFARALQNSKTAEAQAASIGATLDQVQWLTNAGMSQFQSNDLVAARSSYERSLSLAKELHNSEEILGAHVALAYLLLHREPEAAEAHIEEANRLARLRQSGTEELEPSLLEALLLAEQSRIPSAETHLLELVKRAKDSPWVQWEAENTLARLYEGTGQSREAERWFQRAIGTFHRQRLSLKSVELELPFLENGSDLYLDYMEYLIHQHRTDDALAILDKSRAETLAEGLGTSASGSDGLHARALAARLHGTILVYSVRPQASYLWAIDAKKEQFYTLPGGSTILPLVEHHTQSIFASKDLLAQRETTGRALYDALVKPAEGMIGPGGRVFLIADKGLNSLNFETLIPSGDHPHYWIEDATITNARSLRLLAAVDEHPRQQRLRKMLLIGDPVYRPGEYAALPNAAAEMKSVASHFPPEQRSVFAGSQASPANYSSSAPGQFAYIHFVAHATANETNPLDSAIILSPSGQNATYKLYARDVLTQPLDAELVTLSSCYGSGMRNYSGEGVVGLAWAFLRAGSHFVIGAMWEVSDLSTPELMNTLYAQLLNGSRPDAALRDAKLAMLHGDGVFRKPLYWASFQLYSGK